MTKARCELCEKEAMYVPSEEVTKAGDALHYGEAGWPAASIVLKCAYCGNEQRTTNLDEIHHAYHFDDVQRSYWSYVLARERQKVARLQEGRW